MPLRAQTVSGAPCAVTVGHCRGEVGGSALSGLTLSGTTGTLVTMSELHCPSCGHHIGNLNAPATRLETPTSSPYMGAAIEQVDVFLRQRTTPALNVRVESGALRRAFDAWAVEVGDPPLSPQAFGRALRYCGVMPVRSNGVRMYTGVALNA